jgi:hypothetical protein
MKAVLITGVIDEQHKLTAQAPEWMRPGVVPVFVVLPNDDHESEGFEWPMFSGTECTVEVEDVAGGFVRIRLDPERPPAER